MTTVSGKTQILASVLTKLALEAGLHPDPKKNQTKYYRDASKTGPCIHIPTGNIISFVWLVNYHPDMDILVTGPWDKKSNSLQWKTVSKQLNFRQPEACIVADFVKVLENLTGKSAAKVEQVEQVEEAGSSI
jgi:hypothetical protein